MIRKAHRFVFATIWLTLSGGGYAEIADQSPLVILTSSARATPNSLQLGYSSDHYSRTFEDNPISTVQYGRLTSWGSLSLRANSAERYQSKDTQFEVDLYPRLWDGGYAYLNLGTSAGNLFSRNSQGAELFSSIGSGFEGSLGVRHLAFSNSSVTIYTGSISKYAGDYLFTFRPYVTPSNAGTSVSTGISLTRYFADADEYLRIRTSFGKSVEDRAFPPKALTLRSRSIGLTGQWSPLRATFFSPSFTHARQELLFAPGEYVDISTFSATISYRF